MRLPLLIFHICAGISGLLSGTVAMSFRKGSRGHRVAGNIFVIAILNMGVSATCLAFMKHQTGNILGGVLTIYLVGTAWATARRKAGETAYSIGLRCCLHWQSEPSSLPSGCKRRIAPLD